MRRRPGMAINQKDKCVGVASIEMIMILPFCLILILLLANIGKFWHAKMETNVNSRTSAWRSAFFDTVPCVPVLGNFLDELSSACDESSYDDQLLSKMVGGAGGKKKDKDAFLKTIKGAPVQPVLIVGHATKTWGTWGFKNRSIFELEDQYSLDISGSPKKDGVKKFGLWEREDIPLGYDPYFVEEITDNDYNSEKEDELLGQVEEHKQYNRDMRKYREDMQKWNDCMSQYNSEDICGPMPVEPTKPPDIDYEPS